MYIIEKAQSNPRAFRNELYYYRAAREAMKDFIHCYSNTMATPVDVLVPAYIGVSPKEGSGIYDPLLNLVEEGKAKLSFYSMTDSLFINLDYVRSLVELHCRAPFVFLKVNYFGFSDPAEEEIYKFVKGSGGIVLEDNAHGFFSFHRRGEHFCDASFFSLHKQFPFSSGGMLKILDSTLFNLGYAGNLEPETSEDPFSYDWGCIANVRRLNYARLEELVAPYAGCWTLLRSLSRGSTEVPQSFPILLKECDRFSVYTELNNRGFGVTSLYHTMINPIASDPSFSSSQAVSRSILNLPVHQDVDASKYPDLVKALLYAYQANRC